MESGREKGNAKQVKENKIGKRGGVTPKSGERQDEEGTVQVYPLRIYLICCYSYRSLCRFCQRSEFRSC